MNQTGDQLFEGFFDANGVAAVSGQADGSAFPLASASSGNA